jgi:hypothetical protein
MFSMTIKTHLKAARLLLSDVFVCVITLTVELGCLHGQERKRVLSVCDILSNPPRHVNQIVAVEGEVFSGRHGIALVEGQCKARPRGLEPALCVISAGSLNAPQVEFKGEAEVLRAIGVAQRTLQELDPKFVGHATLEGQLFFPHPSEKGLCANNGFPALMVVKAVRRYSVSRVLENRSSASDSKR